MRNPTFRTLFALTAMIVCIGSSAEAGTVLLARESTIRATGRAGATDYNLLDGSQDFSGFSDAVSTSDVGMSGGTVAANQHSRPSLMDEAFVGAYAEGSASAMTNSADVADAVSNFDLTFQISDAPSLVKFGGSAGVAGNGTTTVSLVNETTGESMLEQQIFDGQSDGQTLDYSTTLNPGVYELSVTASANGDLDGSMAYYTVSMSISPSNGVTAIPLPPMAWAAASLLGTGAGVQGFKRLRARSR